MVTLAVSGVLLQAQPLFASVWTGAGGNWSSTASPGWTTGGVPNAPAAVADFSTAGAAGTTIQDVASGVTVGSILLGGNSTFSRTITLTNAITLNQDGAGSGTATISNSDTNATTTALILSAGTLTLADDLLISNTGGSTNTSGAVQISSTIGGAGNVTFSSVANPVGSSYAGAIRVQTATNTFTGNVLIQKGAVTFNSATSFGAAANVITLGQSGQGGASLYTTTGTTGIANNIIVAAGTGGTSVLGSVSASASSYTGTVTLNGDLSVTSATTAAAGLQLSGAISGAGAINKIGAGILAVSGVNSYAGGMNLTAGTLLINSATALGATAGTFTIGNGTVIDNTSGAALTNSNNNPISVGNGFTFTGSNALNLGSGATTLTANSTITTTASTLTLDGLITGTNLSIVKAGAGTLVLSNNGNSATLTLPTGGLMLNAGVLQINGGGALGSTANGGGITLGGAATLRVDGTSASAGIGSSRTLAIGTNTLTLDSVGNTFTVNSAITGTTGSVTKINAGTVTFAGNNTYTGSTNVTGGTVVLAGSSASTAYVLSNSALTLASTGSLAATPTLGLTGSTFTVAAGRTAALTLSGLTVSGGASAFNAGSNSINLGPIVRTGGSVDFTLPASGNLTTTTANTNGILGGYATVNSGAAFATSAGTGTVAGPITAYAGGSSDYSTASNTTNFDAAGSGTFASTSVSTLRFTAPSTATLNGAFVIAAGGILSTPTAGSSASTISGGTSLTSGDGTALIVHQYNQAAPLVVATPIVNNGATAIGLLKAGSGTLALSGANTYTGATMVGGGVVQLGNGGNTGSLTSSAVSVVSGAALAINRSDDIASLAAVGVSSLTGAGALIKNGSNTLTLIASTTYSGGTVINGGVLQFATTNYAGSGGFTINNGALRQTANLSTARTFTLASPNSTIDVVSGLTGSFLISGSITGGGALNVNGTSAGDTGQLTVTNLNNNYTGGTVVNAGTLYAYYGTSLGSGGLTLNGTSKTIINNFNSTSNTSTTLTGPLLLNSNGSTLQIGNSIYANTLTVPGAVSGTGALVKTGPGSLVLTNTTGNVYSGGTVVNQGTLTGVAGAFGTGDVTINPNSITNGTLGLAVDAVGVTSVGSIAPTANVTVNNSANNPGIAGTLTFGGSANTIGSLAGNGNVALGGTALTVGNANNTTFSGVISGTGTSSVTKAGAGTLTLSGSNTYAGGTTVSAGTLRANHATASLGTGPVNVSGGTLAGIGRTGNGLVTVSNGGTITAGTGAAIPATPGTASADVPGTLSSGNQAWASGGKYVWKTTASSGTAGSTWDLLSMATLTGTSGFTVQAILGTTSGGVAGTFNLPVGNPGDPVGSYQIAHTTNTSAIDVSGFILDTSLLGLPAGAYNSTLSFDSAVGGGYDLNLNFQAAPEPTTAALIGLGLSPLLGRRRRKGGGTGGVGPRLAARA